MEAVRIYYPYPNHVRDLEAKMGTLGGELSFPHLLEIRQIFETASQTEPVIVGETIAPTDKENPRIIYAEASLTCRQGFIGTINHLFVQPDYRQQGHGRELLRLIEEFARKSDLAAIIAPTGTWECSELYERCGYFQMGKGIKINKYREDGFQHEKRIYRKDLMPI